MYSQAQNLAFQDQAKMLPKERHLLQIFFERLNFRRIKKVPKLIAICPGFTRSVFQVDYCNFKKTGKIQWNTRLQDSEIKIGPELASPYHKNIHLSSRKWLDW